MDLAKDQNNISIFTSVNKKIYYHDHIKAMSPTFRTHKNEFANVILDFFSRIKNIFIL